MDPESGFENLISKVVDPVEFVNRPMAVAVRPDREGEDRVVGAWDAGA
jgi:hypothetical protein